LTRPRALVKYIMSHWFPVTYARYRYHLGTGKHLRYRRATDMNEKLFWLERYWRHPLVVRCSDKYSVRQYVEECELGELLNELYGVYDKPSEIDFSALPDQFVLKCTHGCQYNMFCTDKREFDESEARDKLERWLREAYGRDRVEWHYLQIRPRIVAERYLQAGPQGLKEVQFFCFHGEPKAILARNDLGLNEGEGRAVSYDLEWRRTFLRKGEETIGEGFEEPRDLAKMTSAAARLAEPFPHVRVDFYEVGHAAVFGEMTFSTSGNILSRYKPEAVRWFGDQLRLPDRWRG
jgi:hypothetical protein